MEDVAPCKDNTWNFIQREKLKIIQALPLSPPGFKVVDGPSIGIQLLDFLLLQGSVATFSLLSYAKSLIMLINV